MTSLFSSLDADALVWRADGSDERIPVASFVTGNGSNAQREGEYVEKFVNFQISGERPMPGLMSEPPATTHT